MNNQRLVAPGAVRYPGQSFGVREPAPGETPLSWEEVAIGQRLSVFDPGPVQVVRPAGTWERKNIGIMGPANVWDGLMP